jgi:hypothetical protein
MRSTLSLPEKSRLRMHLFICMRSKYHGMKMIPTTISRFLEYIIKILSRMLKPVLKSDASSKVQNFRTFNSPIL